MIPAAIPFIPIFPHTSAAIVVCDSVLIILRKYLPFLSGLPSRSCIHSVMSLLATTPPTHVLSLFDTATFS